MDDKGINYEDIDESLERFYAALRPLIEHALELLTKILSKEIKIAIPLPDGTVDKKSAPPMVAAILILRVAEELSKKRAKKTADKLLADSI